jgi:outer membrane receptor for ferrienterochelin and colicins
LRKRSALFLFAGWLFFLVLPLPAQEKTLDELLNLDLSDLLNLKVVSALKGPETINRTPATVRVITAEDIRNNGYFTLEDALADLPGIQFRNILGFNTYSFIRGVPAQNNKVLVLVDGILVNELNSGGFYGGMHYNLADVERIEVVYGPASALYGTNAVSGVISIITRDPKETPGGRVSAGLGNFGTFLADARYGYYDKDADFGFKIAAMFKQSDKADLKGEAGDFNWTSEMENFENDAAVEAQVRFKNFRAGFLMQDKDTSYATAQLGIAREGLTPVSDHGINWHMRFINTWLSYALETKKNWSFRSTAYYRITTVPDDTIPIIEVATESSPGRQYRYYRPNNLIGNETQFQWTPGPCWRFSFGLVLEQERLAETISITQSAAADVQPPVPVKPQMLTNRLISGYAQAQVTLAKPLDLFLGLRHDDSNYYGAVTTPRLGLVFNRDKLTAKILYGQAFRAPKPWDYTNGSGNPNLEPEKISSLEAAGAWSFSPNLRFDLSVYHNRLSNLLTRISEGDDWWWDNAGSLTTNGCEAGFVYRRGLWKAWAYYTYTSSLDDADKQVAEIAPHGANLGVLYVFTSDLRLSLRGQYLGERKNSKIIPSTGSDRIEDAFVAQAALSWNLPKGFDVQLVVNNVFDAAYYHPSILPPSRYRQPQRSFRITAGYSF